MTFKEIKIGDLLDFIASDFYKNSPVTPISPQRAISQYHNPNSKGTDIALILALDNTEKIIGYIGLLPGKLTSENIPYFWNSCWWVSPENGKAAAMPLFYKMLQLSNKKMVFFELTETTKNIVEKFNFKTESVTGFKGFLRFNFAHILPKKNKALIVAKPLLLLADFILNGFNNLKLSTYRTLSNIEIKSITAIDTEAENFISTFKESQLIPINKTELNWIIKYPWIITNPSDGDEKLAENYFFSSISKSFSNQLFKIYKNEKLIAVLFFSIRDNEMKMPYVYFNDIDLEIVTKAIYNIAINEEVSSLTTFNPNLTHQFKASKNPFIFNKALNKYIAYPSDLTIKNNTIQDGDGDAVFC